MRKTYKHFIFDFDGVICDSLGAAIESFNSLREEEFPLLPRVCNGQDGMAIVYSGPLRTCLLPWLTEEESKRFFDLHSLRMAQLASSLKTFPGIGAILALLSPQRCSIVTSAYSQAVQEILDADPDFDASCLFRIAGREFRQTKTDKIKEILKDLDILPEEAIYVGDLESDILYCRDVPIDIISVGYGYHSCKYLSSKHPDYLAGNVEELTSLIQELT